MSNIFFTALSYILIIFAVVGIGLFVLLATMIQSADNAERARQ